ncbi:MAG: hypothetical protein HY925_08800 [Elusimicrobia bacterium]|nr:hypothetical protein [Elusimicrobiota bacterium]
MIQGALLAAMLAVPSFAAPGAAKVSLPPELQVQKAALERTLEERLREALTGLLHTKEVIPVVSVELIVTEKGKSEGGSGKEFVLPGVPVDQEVTKKEKGGVRLVAERRIAATIYVGVRLSGARLDKARRIAGEILDIDPEGGDRLEIESFQAGPLAALAYASEAAWAGLLILGFLFLLFLFGPFRGSLKRLADAVGKGSGGSVAMMGPSPMGGGASSGGGPAEKATVRIAGAGEGDEPLFDFINDDNIAGLVQALTNVNPVLVTSVLECLPRPLAARALAMFPREKRRDIVMQSRQVRYSNPEAIRKMEAQIRAKLGFAYGGVRKMSKILQRIDSATRAAVLEDVGRADPGFAQQIRESVIEFEDLFRYDDRSLLRIVREASVITLARVLKRRPEPDLDRVCQKIGAELGDVLREQVSFTPPLSPEVVEDDFLKIVDIVQRLEASGSINRAPAGGAQPSAAPAAR